MSEFEKNYLSNLSIQKIYPKFFDVDWDFSQKEVVAKATLIFDDSLPNHFEIVPTVFITNRTLINISSDKLPDLAHKIVKKLNRQMATFDKNIIQEIQFDCDWTQSTKNAYFSLLKFIKEEWKDDYNLSATIRLHQIKFANKTGIPPVKRGMLMYYNMGKVQEINTQNSILDNDIGQQYLKKLSTYPLPLDVALPLFQWGVLFRNGKMIKLINQLESNHLVDSQRFGKIDKNHWEVVKSTYLDGIYLYQNDKIRLEKVEIPALNEAARLLQKQLKKENRCIAFYHLDSTVVRNFEEREMQYILESFSR